MLNGFKIRNLLAYMNNFIWTWAEQLSYYCMKRVNVQVSQLVRFYKVPIQRVLVIYDDLDTEVAKLRLKPKGGHGGLYRLNHCSYIQNIYIRISYHWL